MKETLRVIELEIPDLGDAEEIEFVKWYVENGSQVQKGEELAEITTQKVAFTLESPADGKILEICISEGSKVKKGQVACRLILEE